MINAIRFVPFATAPSSPKNIRVGSVRLDPPPALTLIKPATAPTPKSRRRWRLFILYLNLHISEEIIQFSNEKHNE